MTLPLIYAVGLAILVVALLLNILAHRLKLKTWYDFTQSRKDTSAFDYMWLFLLYPLLLGATGYFVTRLLQG